MKPPPSGINPFRPGTGAAPPLLAGRDRETRGLHAQAEGAGVRADSPAGHPLLGPARQRKDGAPGPDRRHGSEAGPDVRSIRRPSRPWSPNRRTTPVSSSFSGGPPGPPPRGPERHGSRKRQLAWASRFHTIPSAGSAATGTPRRGGAGSTRRWGHWRPPSETPAERFPNTPSRPLVADAAPRRPGSRDALDLWIRLEDLGLLWEVRDARWEIGIPSPGDYVLARG